VEHKCQKEFTLLTLGWSDGYVTALFQLASTYFLRLIKATVTTKYRLALIIVQMDLNSAKKA